MIEFLFFKNTAQDSEGLEDLKKSFSYHQLLLNYLAIISYTNLNKEKIIRKSIFFFRFV